MYKFRNGNLKEGAREYKGTVVQKYAKFYVVETTRGYTETVHTHAIGNDIKVVAL